MRFLFPLFLIGVLLAGCTTAPVGLNGVWVSEARQGTTIGFAIADSNGDLTGSLLLNKRFAGVLLGKRSSSAVEFRGSFSDGTGSLTFKGTHTGTSLSGLVTVFNSSGTQTSSGNVTFTYDPNATISIQSLVGNPLEQFGAFLE